MTDRTLRDCRVLVAEDEYMLLTSLNWNCSTQERSCLGLLERLKTRWT